MKNSLKELQIAFLFYEWMEVFHSNKMIFNPTIIEITDKDLVFGMWKHHCRFHVTINHMEDQLGDYYKEQNLIG
jgi:hypothetical protein